jgi:transposase
VRTVRKYVRRMEAGAKQPERGAVPSKLEPFGERIEAKVDQGLSAVQIHDDLRREHPDFDACYESVKLKVRSLRRTEPKVYCRMRPVPGEEAQIDVGEIAKIPDGGGRRTAHLFVMTLCFSRYAYYHLVLDQRVPSFLGAIRRALEFFGGAPGRVKPNNLKSARTATSTSEATTTRCRTAGSAPGSSCGSAKRRSPSSPRARRWPATGGLGARAAASPIRPTTPRRSA